MPGTVRPVGDLFEGYGAAAQGTDAVPPSTRWSTARGRPADPYAAVASSLAQMGPEDVSARASRLARAFMDQGVTFDLDGEERPFPLDVVPRIFTAAEWAQVAPGGGPAGAGPRALPGRRLRRGPDRERRPGAPRGGDQLAGVRPGRLRLLAAQRGAHPRGGDRRHPRRGRRVPGPRGQPAQPVGGQLRAGQPGRHGPRAARALLGPAHPDGDRLPGPPGPRAAPGRAGLGAGPGPHRGGPDPGRAQLGLLRARPVGPPDGRAPGRRARPGLPRHRRLPAHHRGRGPRPRHLPADRRRLPRPAAVPSRVAGGVPGRGQRGARRAGDHRQRRRQRRRRRQARLHLRPGHDPLLPGRGPHLAERRDHAPGRRLACAPTHWPGGTSWSSSGSTGRAARGWSSGPRPPGRSSTSWPLEVEADPRHWIAQRVVALSTSPTWVDSAMATAPRGPAALRGERRRGHLGAARRADPGGPPGGRPGGQLEPGRRLQGHLGGRRRPVDAGAPPAPDRARAWPTRPWTRGRWSRGSSASNNNNSSSNSNNNRRTATAEGRRS